MSVSERPEYVQWQCRIARPEEHQLLPCWPVMIGHYRQACGHETWRPRGMPQEHILIQCLQGDGWCQIGEQRLPVATGELLWLPPDLPHGYGALMDRPWSIWWVHARGPAMSAFWQHHHQRHVAHLKDPLTPRSAWQDLFDCFDVNAAPGLVASVALQHLLLTLSGAVQEAHNDNDTVIETLCEAIHREPAHPWSLVECSWRSGLSRAQLCRRFQAATGQSVIDYCIDLRLRLAAAALVAEDTPVHRIAEAVGYADPYHFSRLFRKRMGLSPSAYRRRYRGAAQSMPALKTY